MNHPDDPPRGGTGAPGDGSEPVGSVGEEAAKLIGALSGWAREQGADYAGSAAGAAESVARAVHDVSEHVATGAEECRYCPVCQVIHAVRGTSPEVRAHLASAAGSLIQAASGLLAPRTDDATGTPVEKIDLDDDSDWDEDA